MRSINQLKRKRRVFTIILVVMFLVASCADSCNPFVSPTQKAVAAIDRAIAALQTESGNWQQTLQELADKTQSTIGHEVSITLDRAIQAAGTKIDCILEHIHDQVIQDLYVLRANLLGQTPPTVEPLFCAVIPDFVDVKPWLEGRTQILAFYGYNFDKAAITILMERESSYVDVTPYLDQPTHYQLTLNLGGTGVPYTPDSRRFILQWNDREIHTIAITQPQPVVVWPDCKPTLAVSEETGPTTCASGFAASGLKCYGSNCDNMELTCCPYQPEADDWAYKEWSPWFSEENPNSFLAPDGFVDGIACNSSYCDNVQLRIVYSPHLHQAGQCQELPAVSEEDWKQSQQCQAGWFIAGMRCMGNYCDEIVLTCCRAK